MPLLTLTFNAGDKMKNVFPVASIGLALVFVAGCADEVKFQKSTLNPYSDGRSNTYFLSNTVVGSAENASQSTLVEGSVWERYGSSAEGTVFKPVGAIVNVSGRHSHEAYIVISSETWVGFWFPYERAFSPLTKSVPVILNKR